MPDGSTRDGSTRDGDRRRTFVPVVLAGLASTGLAAVAGHRPMLRFPDHVLDEAGLGAFTEDFYADATQVEFPLAGALALVALACWGVLLVTRGRVRRGAALLATAAAAGILLVLVFGGFVEDDEAARDLLDQLGAQPVLAGGVDLALTPWFWLALLSSLAGVVAGALAFRLAPAWPAMSSRYDAPRATGSRQGSEHESEGGTGSRSPGERSNVELWKALDEGTDPTS